MKKLLIVPLLVLLSSCVSYYAPQTALVDGVYYAEDDPSYYVEQGGYAHAAYYPWSSLDYFYLGYYAPPGYGYSPWYYPYRYYASVPWYVAFYDYPYYSFGRSHRGSCYYSDNCWSTGRNRRGGDRHDRVAENNNGDGDNTNDGNQQSNAEQNNGGESETPATTKRFVSTLPPGYVNNGGMSTRSEESIKFSKNQLQPGMVAPPSQPAVSSGKSAGRQKTTRTKSNRREYSRSPSGFSSPTSGYANRSAFSRDSGQSRFSSGRSRKSSSSKPVAPD